MPSPTRPLVAATMLAALTVSALAQADGLASPHSMAGRVAATATSIDGSVREVVTAHTPGGAQGTHLIVSTAGKTVDVSTGPWVSSALKEKLLSGASVHVTGFTRSVDGKECLLAQQIVVGGETFTVRNQSGFPMRNASSSPQSATPRLRTQQAGGVQ